ncbi:coilin isoform X2 [Lissotriton helveticus]
MSVPGVGSLRLRLFFDYPPPSSPESCQCWLLLDLSRCRLVTDLSSLIRTRFGFSQRSRLSLYLQECLLPPCEAIGVVRDNDCIRVKLEEVTYEALDSGDDAFRSTRKASKRAAQVWEKEEDLHQKKRKHDFETSPSKSLHCEGRELKKKSKKGKSSSEGTRDSSPEINNSNFNQKKTEKKDRSKAIELENKKRDVTNITKVKEKKVLDDSVNSKKVNISKKSKLPIVRTGSSSSESDSSSTSSLSSNKASSKLKPLSNQSPAFVKKKEVPQPVSANATTETVTKNAMASKRGPSVKPVINTTGKPSSSSSDSDSNKEGNGSTLDKKRTQTDSHCTDAALKHKQKVSANSESSDSSDSSDSDSFVIKKPIPVPSLAGNGDVQNSPVLYGPCPNPISIGRGLARGCGRGQDTVHLRGSRGRGFRGRLRGRGRGNANHFPDDYSTENVKQQQLNHSVTNKSIIIQNPPENPKRDYSAMPLLAAPPPVGQKIAFKLLELAENYSPEVSEYKEGKIMTFNPVTQDLDLELASASGVKIPGKFDLVYEAEGGGRTIEYTIPHDTMITKSWTSLIEPRLIVETLPVSEAATNQSNGGPVVLPQQKV